ncbi:MAG: heme-copper oxidase subunit III [Bacteroidetes bacterium]|nr:MAG: heme-copper oxidase subunit III [Bacteroidota bacterium]TDI77201.1 MAG: heme-copper oxidase subunit III [Bacteroidota bacterium]
MKDYTRGTEEIKTHRAKKMMLWFGIVSLGMSFAGFTSSYIVSRTRRDWLKDLELPQAFYFSLAIIILSSITIHFAKVFVKNEENRKGMLLLLLTFLLGVLFIWFQFRGFSEMIYSSGINFTGPTSNAKGSFIYLIAVVHIAHVVAALISVLVVIYNHYKQKYGNGKTLGIELATTFWHFVDILWIYLFLFFYFVR